MIPEDRFYAKCAEPDENGCIAWTAYCDRRGYGHFSVTGHTGMLAHRVAYELAKGPIADGLCLDHLCFNPICVNPDHLEPVTLRENTLRARARVTHCKNGHPFDDENTHIKGSRRFCRACWRRRSADYKSRKRATA